MMASSDDGEVLPQIVTGYCFVDEKEIPISFTVLPFYSDKNGKLDVSKTPVFLRGVADGGREVDTQVYSWRLRLQKDQAEVMVLERDGKWWKLQKPKKSYKARFRSIMITIGWLYYLKLEPEASEQVIWDSVHKLFSSLDVRPSKNDLRNHVSFIKLISERDQVLAKAKLLVMFLEEELGRRSCSKVVTESNSVAKALFIFNDNMVEEGTEGTDGEFFEEERSLFDSVCAICDNGGEILCCEGKCLRSFHPTKDAGADTYCESLGYSMAQVEAIQNFFCDNCKYKKHQCFACGKLGSSESSDKESGAEVFPCASATCGHFYHPKCVAALLFQESELEETMFQKRVASGEPFTCPVHKCSMCNERENKEIHELQFAICRRCPTSYHRKCLPRDIAFEDLGQGIFQRAWDDLLPNRILMYCMKHKIDEILGTPIRNHIMFPVITEKKKPKIILKMTISESLVMEPPCVKACKPTENLFKTKKSFPVEDSKLFLHSTAKTKPLKESTYSDPSNVSMQEKSRFSLCPVSPSPSEKKFHSSFPQADNETFKRLKSLMDEVSSSLTLKDVISERRIPTTHSYTQRHFDKSVTLGRVEGSVEAIRTALQKLDNGVSTDDAKAVCEPRLLRQIVWWKKNFQVYLAPVLHGMRYTSFGRHFTKVVKLEEIVDKLQWYVQSGDMIVDFCCGANDFSRLLKEKLDAAGKMCSFKNYDIIRPKNDFNFEERDWMSVEQQELPNGSQLIMGLNPPFGIKASLANKFIDKALTFQPKLLILIVPEETERLDAKAPPYDLIWMDSEKLSGKSFYLPGSIDTDEKQLEQWNLNAPPLYLWSRFDWTVKHKKIAVTQGHACYDQFNLDNGYGQIATLEGMELRKILKKRKRNGNHTAHNQFNSDNGYEERIASSEQNLEELEGEVLEKLGDMEKSPTDESVCISMCKEPTMSQSSYMQFNSVDFASGPLPSFLNQGMSCGWLDD